MGADSEGYDNGTGRRQPSPEFIPILLSPSNFQAEGRRPCLPIVCLKRLQSAREQAELAHIETGLQVVLPTQHEKSESILVGSKATIRFVQIDEAALDYEGEN